MKKKSKCPRTSESSRQGGKRSGNRGRPRKTLPTATDGLFSDSAGTDVNTNSDLSMMTAENEPKHPDSRSRSSGKVSAALCRLCHGKFSPRSLRHAFNKWPQDSLETVEESDTTTQSALLFHTDFQHLVGVQVDRDPRLSEFICKKCHAKFYKCHSILIRFLQRVNLPPVGRENLESRNSKCPVNHSATPPSFTSDPKCLHSLVSWAHHHGEACRSCPNLKEVLEGQCLGSVKAVWGCVDGHRYIMDTKCTTASNSGNTPTFISTGLSSGDGGMSEEEEREQEDEEEEEEQSGGNGSVNTLVQHSGPAVTAQTQTSPLDDWTGSSEGHEEAMSPALVQLDDVTADSDLSDRVISEDEFEERGKGGLSDEELFEPYSDKRARRENVPNKRRQSPKSLDEPKVRKKPGPKPGWKNKFKPKGEELPNIYKCPYQGCTAVYRAPDGLKKHIKEHHEEVRERPCPHPGCNKVFMIDRYLQRHVKLIHTDERNYICDQCGQTFKQRKHLSVHQMRHSGAKPLQCEVCGFQCRQRASLKYHMTKHKAEADLEFECLMCRKRFEKAHNLNVHMSMVHPLTQAEAQRGGSQQQQQYADLHTITLTGEVVQQDQDR
ncbi:zinc finger protein 276 isoform X2 [Melanotaenia boesemani]|uniref:zinc finger protein 276 isoform X2 n=1 Tax=Melanotaenia boesemani TaxID=1250792 RepID=UPI001C050BF2|nr:zinc finger protein 276 isoform X2 [Melanotaenia boesemani]